MISEFLRRSYFLPPRLWSRNDFCIDIVGSDRPTTIVFFSCSSSQPFVMFAAEKGKRRDVFIFIWRSLSRNLFRKQAIIRQPGSRPQRKRIRESFLLTTDDCFSRRRVVVNLGFQSRLGASNFHSWLLRLRTPDLGSR